MNVASTPITPNAPKAAVLQKQATEAEAVKPLVHFNALLSLLIGDKSDDGPGDQEQDLSSNQPRGAANRKNDGAKKEESVSSLSSTLLALGRGLPLQPPSPPRSGENAPRLNDQPGAENSAAGTIAAGLQLSTSQAIVSNALDSKRIETPAADNPLNEDFAPPIAKISNAPSSAPIAFAAHLTETRSATDKQTPPFSKGKDVNSALPAANPGQNTTPLAPAGNSKGSEQNPNQNQPKEKPQIATKPGDMQKDGLGTPSDPAASTNSTAPSSPSAANNGRETPKTTAASSATAESAQVESKSDTNPKLRPQPAREISLRIPGANAGGVDLKITEKAGKVQVTVRTDDETLSHSLRSDLGDLVGRLEKKGFTTETWVPGDKAGEHLTNTESAGAQSDPGKQHSGDGSEQGGGARQQGQNRRPQWMNDPETNFSIEQEGEMN